MERTDAKEATPASAWKQGKGAQTVDVPSGNTALVRRKPMDAFLKAGKVPNGLLPLIKAGIEAGKSEIKMDDLSDEHLKDVMVLMDQVVIDCVVQPVVSPSEPCAKCGVSQIRHGFQSKDHDYEEGPRDPDKLYVDEVDFEDKAHIFNWALGDVTAYHPFPGEQNSDVEPVPVSEGVDIAPKPDDGDKG